MSADVLEVVGYGWLAVAVGFFGGFVYLRARTFTDHF